MAAATLLFSCENTEEEINAFNQKTMMVDQATGVEAFLSQGGAVRAKLTAPLMLRVDDDTNYTEFPKTLHVDFYDDSKVITTRLDARYGKYFENLGKIYLKDSIRVVNNTQDTLYCEDLWWDQNKQLFYTDKPARRRSPGAKLNGKNGLQATQDLKSIEFHNVDGTQPMKEGDLPR